MSQTSEECKQFNPDLSEIYTKAWCQWFSFVRNNPVEFNGGVKGAEERIFNLLPSLDTHDIIIQIKYNARKKSLYWYRAFKLLNIKHDRYQHVSFGMCSMDEKKEVYVGEPFRTSRARDWPHQNYVPLKWLQLPLNELSNILEELQQFVAHNAPVDLSVKWGRIRPKTKFNLKRETLQRVLERRYGIKAGRIKSTFGEICAYIVLQQLEADNEATPNGVIKTFLEKAENDALLLVES